MHEDEVCCYVISCLLFMVVVMGSSLICLICASFDM